MRVLPSRSETEREMKPFIELNRTDTPGRVLDRSRLHHTIKLCVRIRIVSKVSERRRGVVIVTVGWSRSLDRQPRLGVWLTVVKVLRELPSPRGLVLQLRVGGKGHVTAGGQLGGEAGVLLVNTHDKVVLGGDRVEHQVEVAHLVPDSVAWRQQ